MSILIAVALIVIGAVDFHFGMKRRELVEEKQTEFNPRGYIGHVGLRIIDVLLIFSGVLILFTKY